LGKLMPKDDVDKIPDPYGLLHRIVATHLRFDPSIGRRRLASSAFRKKEELSVDVEEMMLADGKDWNFSLRNWPEAFLVRLRAAFVRSQGQIIKHTPNPTDQPDNPYHADIVGKKSGQTANAFRDAVEWVRRPDDI
jgi:hypothetical protein